MKKKLIKCIMVGGDKDSTGEEAKKLHVEGARWPRENLAKKLTANEQYAFAS